MLSVQRTHVAMCCAVNDKQQNDKMHDPSSQHGSSSSHITIVVQIHAPKWDREGQDGCFTTQVPQEMAELTNISVPAARYHRVRRYDNGASFDPLYNTREQRVCWAAACGCLRIARKKYKGLSAKQLQASALQCTGNCSGATRKRGLCYCHVLRCKACQKMQQSPVPEEGQMMQATRSVVKERQLHGHNWLVFVEVPITYEGGSMSVDVVLFLDDSGKQHAGRRMLAIEHQGTSHHRTWPCKGNRAEGQRKQKEYDAKKQCVLEALGIFVLYVNIEKTGSNRNACCYEDWKEDLKEWLLHFEAHM